MEDHDHGQSFFPIQPAHQLQHFQLMTDIQIGRRFVQDQNLRLLGQRHGDPHALPLAAGEGHHRPVFQVVRIRPLHGLRHDFFVPRRNAAPPVLIRIPPAGDQFKTGHVFRHLMHLRQKSHIPRQFAAAVRRERPAADGDRPFIGTEIAGDHFQERRLPAAVPAKECNDVSRFYGAVYAAQYVMSAKRNFYAGDFDSRFHHALLLSRYRKNGAPRKAMMIPAGISTGAKTVRPSVSHRTSTPAPSNADPGIRNL